LDKAAFANLLQGNFDRSLELYRKAVFSSVDHDPANLLTYKLHTTFALARSGCAKQAATEAAEILLEMEERLGACHPQMTAGRDSLGVILGLDERHDEAIPILEQVLQERLALLPQAHVNVLRAKVHLAQSLYKSAAGGVFLESRMLRAVQLLEEAVAGREAALGDDHPDTWTARFVLACARDCQGDVVDSVWDEVLAARLRLLGRDHPDSREASARVEANVRRASQ